MAIGGAAGGGKSHALRVMAILWALEIPNLQIALFRRVSNDLVANHIQGPSGLPALLAEYIDSGHCKFNITNNVFKFYNGSQITLCHCQQDKDKWKYQGQEFNVLMIDELTHFTGDIYRFLRSRVRMSNTDDLPDKYIDIFPRIVCSTNPGGVGHQMVKAMFVDPAPPKTIWKTPPEEGGMNRGFYPAKLTDNPYLFKNDPHYVDRLKGLGNKEMVQAFLEGRWDLLAGSMFEDVFDPSIHILPHDWMKYGKTAKAKNIFTRGMDWGWTAPFAVLWFMELAEDYVGRWGGEHGRGGSDEWQRTFKKGSVIVFAEMYGWTGEPNEGVRWSPSRIAETIKQEEANMDWKIQPGPADRSIWDTDTNIASEMATMGVNWIPSDKSPGSRIRGWHRVREYLQNALDSPPEKPGLYITQNCGNLLRTLPLAERDKGKPDDINTHCEDHLLDVLRYKILQVPRKITTQKVIGF